MSRIPAMVVLTTLLVAASSCGGGSSSGSQHSNATSVMVTPTNASVYPGMTVQFQAQVAGQSNQTVTWSIEQGAGGSIDSTGLYSCPPTASPGFFHVIATSQAVSSAKGTAAVTVLAPQVTIAPATVTLAPGGTQTFSATVKGLVNTNVTWTVQEAAGGAVNSTGSYTAPIAPGFYHVVATSVADTTLNGSATITVTTSAGRFTPTGDMVNARGFHTATLLADGKVLMAGGGIGSGPICTNGISSAELYDSGTGSFTATGTMTTPRYNHTATLLATGQVLVVGGFGSTNDCEDLGTPVLNSTELYNPSTASFSGAGNMTEAREKHTATLLANGNVLVAGGASKTGMGSTTAELYDPATGVFMSTGSMATPRFRQTASLLANGKVLIAGGVDTTDPKSPVSTAKAEIYDPSTGTFTPTSNMTVARAGHTATLLATGLVLIAGGSDLPTAEVYDPATGIFSRTGDLGQARASHTATLLPNGTVLITGGADSTAELYDPPTGSFSTTGHDKRARRAHGDSATKWQSTSVWRKAEFPLIPRDGGAVQMIPVIWPPGTCPRHEYYDGCADFSIRSDRKFAAAAVQ